MTGTFNIASSFKIALKVPAGSSNSIGWCAGLTETLPNEMTVHVTGSSLTLTRSMLNFATKDAITGVYLDGTNVQVIDAETNVPITFPSKMATLKDMAVTATQQGYIDFRTTSVGTMTSNLMRINIVPNASAEKVVLQLRPQSGDVTLNAKMLEAMSPTLSKLTVQTATVADLVVGDDVLFDGSQTLGTGSVVSAEGHEIHVSSNGGVVGADAVIHKKVDDTSVSADATHKVRLADYRTGDNMEAEMTVSYHADVTSIIVGTDIDELLFHYLELPTDAESVGVAVDPAETHASIAINGSAEHDVMIAYTNTPTVNGSDFCTSVDCPMPMQDTAESLGMIRPKLDSQGPPTDIIGRQFIDVAWNGTFEYANFRGCEFLGCDLRHCTFRYCDFSGVNFAGCKFAKLDGDGEGSTFECCLINGETQIGSCETTTYFTTTGTEVFEATEKILDVADATSLPEQGILRIDEEYAVYERLTNTSITCTVRGIHHSHVRAHDSGSTVTVEKVADTTFKGIFFDTDSPSVDIQDIPLAYSGKIPGMLPILARRSKCAL